METNHVDPALAEQKVRNWLQKVVIGLQLCPFAKAPSDKGRIRFAVFSGTDRDEAYRFYLQELELIATQEDDGFETTLVIYPDMLQSFDDYLDFLDTADESIVAADLEGIVQVASFHPDYYFEGTDPADITNYTNRSPYPILHLLKEDSISAVVDAHPDIDSIPERNMALMREMGLEKIRELMK